MDKWICLIAAMATASAIGSDAVAVEVLRNDEAGTLQIVARDRELLTYQYGDQYALPHYWPVRSPSGQLLTVQHPDPFPHHRSLWIADRIQAGNGPEVDFYHCWKNYRDPDDPEAGFRHFIRHQEFERIETGNDRATVVARLRWIVDGETAVLDELRQLHVTALADGQYLMDLAWELKPTDEDVRFASDWVHYAWPYVRMHPQFSVDQGGALVDDQQRRGQAETNGQTARWIDYSNTVNGRTEGLAVFLYPADRDRKWLTRDYGAFGPRRPEAWSGTGFTLSPGQSLRGRVGIFVHQGDASSGDVETHYRHYIEGKL